MSETSGPIVVGAFLPHLPCYVPGTAFHSVAEIGIGDHLVVLFCSPGAPPDALDSVVAWPLPTWPRTMYLPVDHQSKVHGSSRVQPIDDLTGCIASAFASFDSTLLGAVVAPSRIVLALVGSDDPTQLRIGIAEELRRNSTVRPGHGDGLPPATRQMCSVLADRAAMLLSPLVSTAAIASQGYLADVPRIELSLLDGGSSGEAIERLVGVGYVYVGPLGPGGSHLLLAPLDEPCHELCVLVGSTP